MKNTIKNKLLAVIFAALLPLAAGAADGLPGATVKPLGKGYAPSAEERKARMEQCKADPAKCEAERKARFEQMCKDNPARCKEMQERREKRRAECKANPEKCRADKKAQFEQRFKRADADGNGAISRAEAQKSMPRLARHFDRIDADKDGQVMREEIAAVRKTMFERRKPRPDAGKI